MNANDLDSLDLVPGSPLYVANAIMKELNHLIPKNLAYLYRFSRGHRILHFDYVSISGLDTHSKGAYILMGREQAKQKASRNFHFLGGVIHQPDELLFIETSKKSLQTVENILDYVGEKGDCYIHAEMRGIKDMTIKSCFSVQGENTGELINKPVSINDLARRLASNEITEAVMPSSGKIVYGIIKYGPQSLEKFFLMEYKSLYEYYDFITEVFSKAKDAKEEGKELKLVFHELFPSFELTDDVKTLLSYEDPLELMIDQTKEYVLEAIKLRILDGYALNYFKLACELERRNLLRSNTSDLRNLKRQLPENISKKKPKYIME